MGTRVQWKEPSEYNLVLDAFHEIVTSGNASQKCEQTWRRAQEKALPPGRWRPFTTSASATDMNQRYKVAKATGRWKKKDAEKPQVIQPAPIPNMDLGKCINIDGRYVTKDVYDIVIKHHLDAHPPQPLTIDTLFRRMLDEQIAKAMPNIGEQVARAVDVVEDRLSAQIKQTFTTFMKFLDPNYKEPAAEVAQPLLPAKAHKPLIAVINANTAQLQSLEKDFPQFDFKVIHDKVPEGNEPWLILGLTRFMDRSLDERLGKKFGDNYIRCTGAASDAKNRLRMRTANLNFGDDTAQ